MQCCLTALLEYIHGFNSNITTAPLIKTCIYRESGLTTASSSEPPLLMLLVSSNLTPCFGHWPYWMDGIKEL